MSTKNQIRIAKASGTYKRLRGDNISNEISKTLPIPDQIATIVNTLDFLIKRMNEIHGEEFALEEFKEYQTIREQAKENVDTNLNEAEAN